MARNTAISAQGTHDASPIGTWNGFVVLFVGLALVGVAAWQLWSTITGGRPFSPWSFVAAGTLFVVAMLILAESVGIALAGGFAAIALTIPLADAFAERMGSLFPIFFVSEQTMLLQMGAALAVGVVAAAIPAWRTASVRIVDGLRAVG